MALNSTQKELLARYQNTQSNQNNNPNLGAGLNPTPKATATNAPTLQNRLTGTDPALVAGGNESGIMSNPYLTKGATYVGQTGGAGTGKKKTADTTPLNIPDEWKTDYGPSQNVLDAQEYLKRQQAALEGMGQYDASPYDQDIANAYNAIMNRGAFRYNVNDDALYQMYRNLYNENGRQASLNAQGQAAGLTGGYGNSYAAAAGAAAYDQYMTQLNDRAIDLYDRAYQRWGDEGQRQLQNLQTATGMADRDYQRWEDAYNRALNERNTAYDMYGKDRARDYQMYNDQMNRDYNIAVAMIKAGVTPDGQMLRNAGISEAELRNLKAVYKKSKSSGGGGKNAGISDLEKILNDAVDKGTMTAEDAVAIYVYTTGQGVRGTASEVLNGTGSARTMDDAKAPKAGKSASAESGGLLEQYKNMQKKNN